MNRTELTNRLAKITSTECANDIMNKIDYNVYSDVIEVVYCYHPNIDSVRGKDQVAMLLSEFGVGVFYDMLPTALKAKELEQDISKAREKLKSLEEKYNKLKLGQLRQQ